MPFRCKDGKDMIHGPDVLSVANVIPGILPLYYRRELRKYHTISTDNKNNLTVNLYRSTVKRIDYLWLLKMYRFFSYKTRQEKIYLNLIMYTFVMLYYLTSIAYQINYSWKHCVIQSITVIIVSLCCRLITSYYIKYNKEPTNYPSVLHSRYSHKLKSTYEKLGICIEQNISRGGNSCFYISLPLFFGMICTLCVITFTEIY